MSDPIIKVESISKKYRIGVQKKRVETFSERIKDTFMYPINNFRRIASLTNFNVTDDPSVFWALKDINFEINQGDVVGIIGHNGAGKSTLLKILSRITEPTTGKITLKGRVSALLEVGTGFHPELTGRDNVYMNGTILGMTKKEIDDKFDEILDFSGIEQYIDTPVKFYSSGMRVRLAFSVAAHLEPDILVIDEVLAVGDAEFQKKCLGKMKDVAGSGRTVLFVSHHMPSIRNLCNTGILLNSGKVEYQGEINALIGRYLNSLKSYEADKNDVSDRTDRKGSQDIQIVNINSFCMHDEIQARELVAGSRAVFEFQYKSKLDEKSLILRVKILNHLGEVVTICNNFHSSEELFWINNGNGVLRLVIDCLPLIPGNYSLDFQLRSLANVYDEIENAYVFDVQEGDFFGTGKLPQIKEGVLMKHQWELNETEKLL